MTIHDGEYLFGGGNRDILIHTAYSELYYEDPDPNHWLGHILEEVLVHEAAHVSLDPRLYRTDEWNEAVAEDNKFASEYAK